MNKNFIVAILFVSLLGFVVADTAPFAYHTKTLTVQSAKFDGTAGRQAVLFQEVISIKDAAWLQLHFGDCELGNNSFILIKAKKDGAIQRFDAKSLKLWNNTSAYFNGNEVTVELHVAGTDRGVSIECKEVVVGEHSSASSRTICGPTDDRTASNHEASGRTAPVGCTGWIIANGAYLTAGHCIDPRLAILQFNVPLSNPDGSLNHSHPDDQYPIIKSSIQFRNGGPGNDWAIYACGPNSNTGLTAIQAQGQFFRVSDNTNPAGITITGFGVDNLPRGSKGGNNKDSQTQQTNSGTFAGLSGTSLNYVVDTTGGNSGSPVINTEGENVALGIHTHGGCRQSGGSNLGTSFSNSDLMKAINDFSGNNVLFVDKDHPQANDFSDGSIVHPFTSLTQAIAKAPANSIVTIISNVSENEIVIDKPLTIALPTGIATIQLAQAHGETSVIDQSQVIRGQKVFSGDKVIVKNLVLESGADVTIKANELSLVSSITVPEGTVLRISVK